MKNIVLGTRVKPDGKIETVELKPSALTTHACVVGSSGSGKTACQLNIVEDLIDQGIPCFLVDNKSDLLNIALQKNKALAAKMAVRCLTPGGDHGEQVNIFSGISNPDRVTSTVSILCKMLGVDSDPIKSKAHAFISTIIHYRLRHSMTVTIMHIIADVVEPPFSHLGMFEVDDVIPKSSRGKLAAKLNNLLAAPGFENWRTGVSIDIPKLLECAPGKVPVIVYSVAHLIDDSERIFATSMFLEEMLSWMKQQPGTKDLKTCLLLDEMYGVMPPHPANPPSKKPLLTMIKQGRAHGLGVIICSQNPMDMDYKGMSNAQTWLVGRLQTQNDRQRVIGGICASTAADSKKLEASIARLQPRQFLIVRPSGTAVFTTRECSSDLRGPMSPNEIRELFDNGTAERVMHMERLELALEIANAQFEINKSDANWKAVEEAHKELEDAKKV